MLKQRRPWNRILCNILGWCCCSDIADVAAGNTKKTPWSDIASIVLFLVMNMRKKVSEQTHCVLSVQAVDFNHPPAPQIPIHPLVSSHSKFSKEPKSPMAKGKDHFSEKKCLICQRGEEVVQRQHQSQAIHPRKTKHHPSWHENSFAKAHTQHGRDQIEAKKANQTFRPWEPGIKCSFSFLTTKFLVANNNQINTLLNG